MISIVIVATALVALGASMSGGIAAAGDAINMRAARESCRTLLEAAVANNEQSGGRPVPGHENLSYTLTRESRTAGAVDSPEEKYDVITVTVTYPSDTATPAAGQASGSGKVSFSTIVDPPDLDKTGAPTVPGKTPGR